MKNSFQIKAAATLKAAHGYSASVVRLRNTSAVSIDYSVRGGSAVELAAGASAVVDVAGLTSEIAVRRTDLSATPANVLIEFGLTADEAYEQSTAAAAASTASHLTAPDAHGFGVYTVAQLNAFTSANRPIGCVFCSDCLTPEGVGSPVVWSGTQWMCTCASIPATTDELAFFRALRLSGKDFFSDAALFNRVASRPYGVGTLTGNGGASSLLYDGETTGYGTGVQVNGYAFSCQPNSIALLLGSNYFKAISSIYTAAEVFLQAPSSAADIFAVIGTGLVSYDTAPNTLAASAVGLYYDPQNAYGLGNTGGIANWLAVTRRASVQSMTNTGVAPTSTFATRQLLETVVTPTTVRFFIAGTEIASIPQTNIPATAVLMQSTGIVKIGGTTGTTSCSMRARKTCVAVRYS